MGYVTIAMVLNDLWIRIPFRGRPFCHLSSHNDRHWNSVYRDHVCPCVPCDRHRNGPSCDVPFYPCVLYRNRTYDDPLSCVRPSSIRGIRARPHIFYGPLFYLRYRRTFSPWQIHLCVLCDDIQWFWSLSCGLFCARVYHLWNLSSIRDDRHIHLLRRGHLFYVRFPIKDWVDINFAVITIRDLLTSLK